MRMPRYDELICDVCDTSWWMPEGWRAAICPACGKRKKRRADPRAAALARMASDGNTVLDEIDVLVEKVSVYERFLHSLHMASAVTMDADKVGGLIARASDWSYAHRQGNGTLSEEEQHALVRAAFERLLDVS